MTGENQLVDASRSPDVPPPSLSRVPPGSAERPSRARRMAAPALYLAGAAAAFAYVGAVDPNEPGHYPVCPMLRLTGILCPGCGGLRSAHAFAHGDLITAAGANALAVAGYFAFAAFMALWLVRAYRGGPVPRLALRRPHWWGLGVLALAFVVVRNLSFGAALAP